MTLNLLTFLGGWFDNRERGPQHTPEQRAQYEADGFVYCDILAELDTPAACDKHRELVQAAQIEALQRRIVERGGTVHVDDITPILPPVATYPVKVRILTPAQHAARLKERKV